MMQIATVALCLMWVAEAEPAAGNVRDAATLFAPPLDAVQFDDCATSMADALRTADWSRRSTEDVILSYPLWRNESGYPMSGEQEWVGALVAAINARSGALVRFAAPGAAGGSPTALAGAGPLATELALTGPRRSGQRTGYGLTLIVRERGAGAPTFQHTFPFRLSAEAAQGLHADAGVDTEADADANVDADTDADADVVTAPEAPRGERLDDVVREVEEDIERRVRFPWGRVYFLDEKSAERVMVLSRGEKRDEDRYEVSLEVMSQKGGMTLRVRACFADDAGLVVGRLDEKYELAERQRRPITLSTSGRIVRTVVLIERD